jgi:heme iron utilization protein
MPTPSGPASPQGAAALLAAGRWLALATTDASGRAAVSYVPFALVGEAFGVALSRLANHTAHLLARPAAAVLLTAEPGASEDPYARPRLSIEVLANVAPRGSPASLAIWDALEKRHGPTVSVLRGLPDFETMTLAPHSARFVAGFAAARDLDAATLRRVVHAAALGGG